MPKPTHKLLLALVVVALSGCSQKQGETTFSPAGSEFKVTFPAEPKMSEVTGQGGLFAMPTTMKVATIQTSSLMFRADVAAFQPNSLKPTNEQLTSYAISYAQNQGFESIETTIEEKSFAKCVVLRGVKKFTDKPYQFLTRMCLGKHTLLTQYVASPAPMFPPSGTTAFMDSLVPV